MNNRGQIYLIAALILSVVIFLLVSQTNVVQRILFEDDFEQLSKNFDVESAKFMNSLLFLETLNINFAKYKFEEFTTEFTKYVNVENPEYEFIYVLDYEDNNLVGYYIMDEVIIGGTPLESSIPFGTQTMSGDLIGGTMRSIGESKVTLVNDTSYIQIGDMIYNLNIQAGTPQIVIISREERDNQTKVFLNEGFITGERV